MKIKIYQIDAFASKSFEGNPAAVCPLQEWLPDDLMQAIAEENNVSETAFFVPEDDGFYIRWFTPGTEVKLCGHATLASAYVLFNILGYKKQQIDFDSKSGVLSVTKNGDSFQMDFPAQVSEQCDTPADITEAFGMEATECLKHEDYVLVFDNPEQVINAAPDMEKLKKVDARGIIITAPSDEYDFICRFFAPASGINEDPVTGSAFTKLVPYWAQRSGKNNFHAKQVSKRGGEVLCELKGDRVILAGKAIKFLEGSIEIDI